MLAPTARPVSRSMEEVVTGTKVTSFVVKKACEICSRAAIVDPIVCVECKHISCWSCLRQFQRANATNKCPDCRSEMPELVQPTLTKAKGIIARVEKDDLSLAFRKASMSKALANMCYIRDQDDPASKYTFPLDQARILSSHGYHNSALKVLEDVLKDAENGGLDLAVKYNPSDLDKIEEVGKLNLDTEGNGISKSELATVYELIAEMHMKLGKWKKALMAYQTLEIRFPMPGPDQMTTDQHGAMMRGAQECLYQMKKYDQCIEVGQKILKAYKFAPSALKASALAYKAMGNMKEARKLAAKALLGAAACYDESGEFSWNFWEEINDESIVGPRPYRF
ncbi:hypothetical protein FisN_1Hu683 [Fistulifera solaris]|uniref:RING-type domain-containing protein n=1 Tax=Fistulifera solaris TaxID=1519565 RepID=A0A1Z5JMV5_FISSO|nr:hypothetical protein FisN_1Hu683 [Fistulifera solaris]|eukprot:GAX15246.1 hypothetical protein FisN_1Hu683 [Fistulifera solaris]